MSDNFSRELIKQIEVNLKNAVHEAFDDPTIINNCEQIIVQQVNSKITSLSNKGNRLFAFPQQTEIKSIAYTAASCNNSVITGKIVVNHHEKQDIHRYGGPGYAGKENGQVCEYPKGSRKFYKWNSHFCKWQDIYHSIDRGNNKKQSWSDRLTNNAAFEPWWGDNTSGGNYLRSDRHNNGADDLWGDPGVRGYMGTFNQISADIMQSIYRFTLNLESAIDHFEKLNDVFEFGDDKSSSSSSSSMKEVYATAEEEPKVKIMIEKLYRWSVWESYGRIQQSGIGVKKDTVVFSKDSSKVRQFYKNKANSIKKKARKDFENDN